MTSVDVNEPVLARVALLLSAFGSLAGCHSSAVRAGPGAQAEPANVSPETANPVFPPNFAVPGALEEVERALALGRREGRRVLVLLAGAENC